MKKILLVAALFLGSTLGVYAQQTENKDAKYKVETNNTREIVLLNKISLTV